MTECPGCKALIPAAKEAREALSASWEVLRRHGLGDEVIVEIVDTKGIPSGFGRRLQEAISIAQAGETEAAADVAKTIKAELFDLQSHVCNGRLTVFADGQRDPNDRQCPTCARVRELRNRLKELVKKIGAEQVNHD